MHIKVLAALVLALGTVGVAWAQQDNAYSPIFTVEASSKTPTVAVGGTVVPFKEVTLAAQVPGRVKFLAGIEGDSFKEGDTLVAIDETEMLAKRNAAYAQLAAADSQLRNAGVQYSRELWSPRSRSAPGGMGVPNLFDQMFTQPAEQFFGERDRGAERSADLYASRTGIEKARSAMLRAQAEIRAIDAKLRDAKSLAPFDGKVVQKYVEVGDTVQPGQPLVKYADVTWLQIEVDVPARLVSGLQELQVLKRAASFDDHDQPEDVRVAQIYPMADARRHTFKVKFDVPHGVSQPGMYAKVQIPDVTAIGESGRLPTIPTSAIRYRGSLPVVYVQNAEGRPELRMIREGRRMDEGRTTVLSGLAPGDRIYSNPGPDIMAGVDGRR